MDTLNTLTQEILADVVQEANGGWFMPRGCNATASTAEDLVGLLVSPGTIQSAVLLKTAHSRSSKPLSTNLYTEASSALDSPVLGGLGQAGNPMGTVLNLDGLIVGSDKFEHVFGFGYGFYRLHYEFGLSLESILGTQCLVRTLGLWVIANRHRLLCGPCG